MKRLLAGFYALLVSLAFAGMAAAAPLASFNSPVDTIQAAINVGVVSPLNTNYPMFAVPVACSGTTTATCQGLRMTVSVTGLSTAAGVTSATMTVTDASVTASSMIQCMANGYTGTGNPNPVVVVPGAGSFTFAIQNSHASSALNATVPVVCQVTN